MLQTKFVEEIKTHVFCSMTFFVLFFVEDCSVYEMMWKKYCRAGQATEDNMAQEHCVLDTHGYQHTVRIYRLVKIMLTLKL
jgi:hypothetical protein